MSLLRRILEGSAALPLLNSVLPFVRRSPGTGASDNEAELRHELAQFAHMLHGQGFVAATDGNLSVRMDTGRIMVTPRSEEHTSELQSHLNLVCRLLLEKK